ncbi:hypothetical protein BTVI_85998 [Pitangus sulphuratus]|nr:hypothetical protein BTVI_85998 [Pitangus sulphuratus]
MKHFQTMLKTKLNVLTLRKEPLPTVIFHEPEAIELCTTTPLMKTRTHTGCKLMSMLESHDDVFGVVASPSSGDSAVVIFSTPLRKLYYAQILQFLFLGPILCAESFPLEQMTLAKKEAEMGLHIHSSVDEEPLAVFIGAQAAGI